MDRLQLITKLSKVELCYDNDTIECIDFDEDYDVGVIDEAFLGLTKEHAVIYAKIFNDTLRNGRLKVVRRWDTLWMPPVNMYSLFLSYIEDICDILPLTISYTVDEFEVRFNPDYYSMIVRNQYFNDDFDNKTILEISVLFITFYCAYQEGSISLSYFKRFLRQRIVISDNTILSYKLQFLSLPERFIYFLLIFQFKKHLPTSLYLSADKLFESLYQLDFKYDEYCSDFLDLVSLINDEGGHLEGFSLNHMDERVVPTIVNDSVEKTLRILRYDLLGPSGLGHVKIGIVCKSETFKKIIAFVSNEGCNHYHVRMTRFLILDDELGEAFLKSIIIDIKSFLNAEGSGLRRFILISDFETVFRFAREDQHIFLYDFAFELFSIRGLNSTLVVKTNNYDIFDTDITYEIESDVEDVSMDSMLKSAKERVNMLEQYKKV